MKIVKMNSSSSDSDRLPEDVNSPERPQLFPEEPLSTKREKLEARRLARDFSRDRFFSREVCSAPAVQRSRHCVAPRAHAILFRTPTNTPATPPSSPVGYEMSDNQYCRTDHECTVVPLYSPFYKDDSNESYFEQCFIIEKKLGEGSFGEVFQATFKEDGQTYAVKRALHPYRSSSDRAIQLREVQKLDELVHPNLIYFHRAWEEKGHLYMQTELCIQSLSDYCRNEPPPTAETWNILYDMLNALDFLHARRLVHLDVKPENIFLTSSKICKLGDFGLMFDLLHDHKSMVEEGDSKYLAPEVLNNLPTPAADIFSLGISLLEVATNLDLPSNGKHWRDLRENQLPDRFMMMLEPDLRRIISLMLQSQPVFRPSTSTLIHDPAIFWPFKRRRIYVDVQLKVATVTRRVSSLLSYVWLALSAPLSVLSTVVHSLHGSTRGRVAYPAHQERREESTTPEAKRLKRPGPILSVESPQRAVDYDSSFSDEENQSRHPPDPLHRSLHQKHFAMLENDIHTARDLTRHFYSKDAPPLLIPSLSPFKNDEDLKKRRSQSRAIGEWDEMSPPEESPSRRVTRAMRAKAAASAPAQRCRETTRARLLFESDDDDDEEEGGQEEEAKRIRQSRGEGTPKSASSKAACLSPSTVRSPLRYRSKAIPKLDFSILDQLEENETEEDNGLNGSRKNLSAGDA